MLEDAISPNKHEAGPRPLGPCLSQSWRLESGGVMRDRGSGPAGPGISGGRGRMLDPQPGCRQQAKRPGPGSRLAAGPKRSDLPSSGLPLEAQQPLRD